ncbi:hypothetical protein [Paenibacillus thalictri]|uniref:Uncharacterized protein n=1 Tax=Paenibacillus thalictri TaxID=2527873 RepID=A0A4Q9DZU5_9BACL|nr:hypothetical protein [Paenibacillus thalictri]TBL81373.1 hypothetical protein EYB31_04655 [Paenibacillus thalictri]
MNISSYGSYNRANTLHISATGYGTQTGSVSTGTSSAAGKKTDSVQFSPEAMERFAKMQENSGSMSPSKVDLSTDDKKRILSRIQHDYGTTTASAGENAEGTEETDSASETGSDESDVLAALKEQLSSLDLDSASDDEINSAFEQVGQILHVAGSDGSDAAGSVQAGSQGRPPGGPPPGGMPPGGPPPGGGVNGTDSSSESETKKLLELLLQGDDDDSDDDSSSDDEDDTTTASSTDYASKLKEQLAKYNNESLSQLDDDTLNALIQELSGDDDES